MKSRSLVFVLALAFAAACAHAGGRTPATPAAMLQVDNQGLADMDIYIINGSQRLRVGFAAGLRKTMLTIPRSLISASGDVAFLADPVGSSRTAVSSRIYVQPGDTVSLVIPP